MTGGWTAPPDATAVRRFLGLPVPPRDVPVTIVDRTREGAHERLRLEIGCVDGDTMPAFLLVPDGAADAPGVVVFHQHASQWHLGKSEACGLVGDPTQAFGRALVEAGLVVLAPDAVGFEDRRRTTSGTEPHPDDRHQHERELAYRLLAGGTMAAKVLADAQTALSVLRERPEVDVHRVGVVGHSFGGNTVIFHTAVDERVAFAATSGAAGTYRDKMANELGIDRAEVIPGVLDVFDIDDLTRLVCPRPLAIFAGDGDDFANDAAAIIEVTRRRYRTTGHGHLLHGEIVAGGHALTPPRSRAITDWVARTAWER